MKSAMAGWQKSGKIRRPRKTSDARLAADIVHSIRVHAEVGTIRTAADYTVREEVIEMVNAILAKGE